MKIYVGNLNFRTTEESLREAFAAFGEVQEVAVVTDRDTGRPRGFAFVTMPDDAQARAAIEALNGNEFEGRNLNVNEARPKTPGGNGGGRGGYGGGRGGNGGGRRDRWWKPPRCYTPNQFDHTHPQRDPSVRRTADVSTKATDDRFVCPQCGNKCASSQLRPEKVGAGFVEGEGEWWMDGIEWSGDVAI